jgi:crossover junction endodeoxyribonuclease RusA
MALTVTLPWFPHELSPNRKVHWAAKARAVKAYRNAVFHHTKESIRYTLLGMYEIELNIKFHPPTRHRYDLDNMLAAFKSGIDGISQAIGIDDSKFTISISKHEPVMNGKIIVEIT